MNKITRQFYVHIRIKLTTVVHQKISNSDLRMVIIVTLKCSLKEVQNRTRSIDLYSFSTLKPQPINVDKIC